MFRKIRRLLSWRKTALFLVVAAAGVVAYSWVYNRPIQFRPKRAPASFDVSRPSGTAPDNIVLVPAGDMATSISVTWRTSDTIADGVVRYRKDGAQGESAEVPAVLTVLTSPELRSDNTVHCFSAALAGLEPGATYSYRAGSKERDIWSEEATFTTAGEAPETFSFVYMADTQNYPDRVGKLLGAIETLHPETAFFMNSGDVVDMGELRNQWDEFLANTGGIFSRKPFAPAVGNHDPGDWDRGLPAFNAYFNTPGRNPKTPAEVENYSFRYGAARFIVINRFNVSGQTEWLEKELRAADAAGARWKIVMFHHPVYNPRRHRSNAAAQKYWVPLFDKYKVDLVLTGHDHSYVRSHPLNAGKPAPAGAFGTTYIVSTACERFYPYETLETAKIQFAEAATCQVITLSAGAGGRSELRYRAYTADGKIRDRFAYAKPKP